MSSRRQQHGAQTIRQPVVDDAAYTGGTETWVVLLAWPCAPDLHAPDLQAAAVGPGHGRRRRRYATTHPSTGWLGSTSRDRNNRGGAGSDRHASSGRSVERGGVPYVWCVSEEAEENVLESRRVKGISYDAIQGVTGEEGELFGIGNLLQV